MIKGSKEELDQIVGTHSCPEHLDNALTVAWHQTEGYVLRCGAGHFPEEVTRHPSLTQQWKAGELPDEPIKDNIERRERRKAMTQGKQSTAVTMGGVPATDLATGELLLPEVIQALVSYARKYDLDPVRGHVVMMYSKPYITIDGYLFHANRSGKHYSLRSRPMTSLEVIDYKIEPTDFGWVSELELTESGAKFTGLGIVTLKEMTAESKGKPGQLRSPVVAKYPWQLAQKRAEWQALRRAFPIGETDETPPENATPHCEVRL